MTHEIIIPDLSDGTEVALVNWLVAVGDAVSVGDVIAELESDKTVVELTTEYAGFVSRLVVDVGTENLKGGAVVARIASTPVDANSDGDSATANERDHVDEPLQPAAAAIDDGKNANTSTPLPVDPSADSVAVVPSLTPLAQRIVERVGIDAGEAHARSNLSSGDRVTARDLGYLTVDTDDAGEPARIAAGSGAKPSPLARRMLELSGQSPDNFRGSGPDGRLLASDIGIWTGEGERRLNDGASQLRAVDRRNMELAQASAPFEVEQLSAHRKAVADRLAFSKSDAPHYYMSRRICGDALASFREMVNADLDQENKVSLNDVLAHVVAIVLGGDNTLNACWHEDGIRRFGRVDLAVAVAGERGLITPVLRDATGLGLLETSRRLRLLIGDAMTGKLTPKDYQGGTFSLSNLGMFGVREFAAILNLPQAGILAIGAIEPELRLVDGEPAEKSFFTTTLSVDHRVADGVDGARFLQRLQELCEDPRRLLL